MRASQALGISRVRSKYAIPANEFSTEDMDIGMDMMLMIDDTSSVGTAPWVSSSNERGESPMRASSMASSKSKTRWKIAGSAVHQTASSYDAASTNGSAPLNLSPTKSPGLKRASGAKPFVKRVGSIRGDLNMLLNGINASFESQPTQQSLSAQRAELPQNLDARIFCARSLFKLSCQVGSELPIIHGGAIAQIADFSDIDNPKLLRYCAGTLANLTTDNAALDAFVEFEGIQALLELSWSPCIHVKILCATALCRLTQHGTYARSLARSKAVIELLSMLTLPHDQLQALAVSCILNLVFHGHLFPERVFIGEPHAVQNQIGVMSVVSQLAASPTSTQFAAEVLFNLSLYRVSCYGALRGGGADLLHSLATLVCKALEETGNSSSRYMSAVNPPVRTRYPEWASNSTVVMRLLFLIAETLGNFSAYVEFHGVLSSYGMKTLTLLLFGALRDVGSKLYGAVAEERLKNTAVACSRALANFSSNEDLRKHAFLQEMVHMTTRLALLDRQRFVSSPEDSKVFFRNIVRTLCNLSFNDTCTAYFMEFPQVLPLLHAIVVSVEEKLVLPETFAAAGPPRVNLFADEDVKEDALVTILNLAKQAAYSNDLVRILDGKRLAIAAEDASHSGRLKYIYSLVLCNLLFESRLQQIVYGDTVIRSLVYGFYFFGTDAEDLSSSGNTEQAFYKSLNMTFGDDQERFLAAICIMASEIMDASNIERIIGLVLDCLKRPAGSTTALNATLSGQKHQRTAIPERRHQVACFAAAALYTLARSSTHRGDTNNLIYSSDIEATLISVCERTAADACSNGSESQVEVAHCGITQAFCAATLYHLCASGHVNQRIIQALINCCNSNEETLSLLACAASFAIISFTPEGRNQLITCEHLAKALNRLGRTSQPECQQYAAIAACNVSTLECIWTSIELKDFIVMALLRANSVQAKQIHAKTLSNLLSHLTTREKVVEDGVLYALMKLSQVMVSRNTSAPHSGHSGSSTPVASIRDSNGSSSPRHTQEAVKSHSSANSMDEVFSIGLQALFNLSCEHQYHQKLLSNGVMPYLAAAVAGKHANVNGAASGPANLQTHAKLLTASSFLFSQPHHNQQQCHLSVESRRYAMGIICNLSSYDENHKELMNAQVTDIIRKYVDQDIETRASAAMALRNLSCKQPWVEMLCERKTLHLFITFTQCDHQIVKRFAAEALANCSLITDSLHLYGELRVPRAVLTLLEDVSKSMSYAESEEGDQEEDTDMETCMAALKCLHNIAFDDALALSLLEGNAVLRLLPLLECRSLGNDEEGCFLVATMVNTLAGKPKCAEALLRQRVVSLCALLHRQHPESMLIAFECVGVLMKLSTYQQIQEKLTETQAIHVIVSICSSPHASTNLRIRECGAITIRNLTLSVTDHLSLFYGDMGLEGADNIALSGESNTEALGSGERTVQADRSKKASANIAQRDFFDEVGDATDDSKVSRVTERHLLHGVKYFQQELECLSEGSTPSKFAANRILQEACAGIANLSTTKVFRVAMVRLGVINTLLRVFQLVPGPHTQVHSEPSLLKQICSATLHRLAVEDEAAIDGNELLVPSLLSILTLTDEELHHVRYECEKVSLFTPNAPDRGRRQARVHMSTAGPSAGTASHSSTIEQAGASLGSEVKTRNRRGSVVFVAGAESPIAGLTHIAMAATAHCVRQTYREQKWMLFVLKTTLSSASMIPQLEKKQLKTIGVTRLSFQDTNTAPVGSSSTGSSSTSSQATFASMAAMLISATEIDSSASPESAVRPKGGYLLPVNADKYMVRHDECNGQPSLVPFAPNNSTTDNSIAATLPGLASARSTTSDASSTHSQRDAPDLETMMHSRKFDRHMRITRRNHRRNPHSLPALSMLN